MKYASAYDFRRALGDRLSRQAAQQETNVNVLKKRLVFERFLARLYAKEERWVLKGGYALELRLRDKARTTLDIDLGVPLPPIDDLLDNLQRAAEVDLDDYFEFQVRQEDQLGGPPEGGFRFHIDVRLGGTLFDSFKLDVSQGDPVVTDTEWIDGQVDLGFAGVRTPRFAVLPIAAHFADKLHAYTRPRQTKTRVKDFADMLLLLDLELAPTPELRTLIELTFALYCTHELPESLPRPPEEWENSYTVMAQDLHISQQTLNAAYERLQSVYSNLKDAKIEL